MRITMSMIMKKYATSLNSSLDELNKASDREISQRRYDTASEDPFSAAKAARLRMEYAYNNSYQSEVGDAKDQMDTVHSTIQSIVKVLSEASSGSCLGAINGTNNADDRKIYAEKIRGLQKTILTSLNTKFGDKYIFGGAETENPPFSVGANGNLLYRGIDVNTGKIEAGSTLSYNGAQITLGDSNFNGYKIQVTTADGVTPSISADATNKILTVNLPTGAKNSDVLAALKANPSLTSTDGTVTYNLSKVSLSGDQNRPVDTGVQTETATDTIGLDGLQKLADEQVFSNIGLGLRVNTGAGANKSAITEQSVFNIAVPGISVIGFGTVDGSGTGMSNNIYNLMGQIADQLEGKNGYTYSIDTIQPYLDQFTQQQNKVISKMTETDCSFTFLTTTQTNLEDLGDRILEKDDNTEFIDFTDAWINYSMQAFAYNAALKIGNQILQPTFLDFMK